MPMQDNLRMITQGRETRRHDLHVMAESSNAVPVACL